MMPRPSRAGVYVRLALAYMGVLGSGHRVHTG